MAERVNINLSDTGAFDSLPVLSEGLLLPIRVPLSQQSHHINLYGCTVSCSWELLVHRLTPPCLAEPSSILMVQLSWTLIHGNTCSMHNQ